MASAAGDSAAYGGVGGAFRRKRHRGHQSTPYDRPATAIRSSQRNNGGGWLSKIVDPASKLITAGAHKLFSSVFRKRLLPPPSPPQQPADGGLEPRDGRLEAATAGDSFGLHEGAVHDSRTEINSSQVNGVSELESILKQKTFTRSEIDHLTALLQSRAPNATSLQSRAPDATLRTGEEKTELNSQAALDLSGEQLVGSQPNTRTTHSGSPGTVMTPALVSKVREDGIASPAELAKAYMGSRTTKVSPSMLGSRTQIIREEVPVSNALSHLRTPGVAQVQKPHNSSGILENNIMVPFSRGRHAIYRETPSPYSRVQPVGALKGFGSRVDACDGGPSSSSSQRFLKRRHSVLENDIGSVGPIRRTRQKSNLVHLRGLGLPSSSTLPLTKGITSDAGETSSAAHSSHGYSSLKTPVSKMEKSVPMRISSKSIEMGERILQQLEKLTPPGEKPSEKKPGALGNRFSTMEMTPAMLHGKARRSLETVDSLRLLEHAQDGGEDNGSVDPDAGEGRTSLVKRDIVHGDSKNKITMYDLKKGVAKIPSSAETSKPSGPIVSNSAVDVPKRSRAFQMSALEDFEFDDDVHSNGFSSSPMNGDEVPPDNSSVPPTTTMLRENREAADKTDVASASPELQPANNLLKKNVLSGSSVPVLASDEKSPDSSLPAALVSSALGSTVAPSTISESNNAAFASPSVSFGNNGTTDKSSASFFASSSAQESSFLKDVKSNSPSSVVRFSTPTMETPKSLPGSDNRRAEENLDTIQKSKSDSPFTTPTLSDSPFATPTSFVTPANSSASMSGLFCFSTSTSLAGAALFSNQSEANGGATSFPANTFTTASAATASVGVTTSGSDADKPAAAAPNPCSTDSLTTSSISSPFSSAPAGSSSSVAATSGFSSTPAVTTISASKSQEQIAFGNSAANPTSSAANTGTVSTGFHFGASATYPSGSIHSPASSHDTSGSKTIFGNLPTSTPFAASTESTHQQHTSSTALLPPSSSGNASLTSVSPIFGTSTPASGSGFALGSSSSTSTSTTISGSTQSGSTSIFGSSWKAPDSTTAFGSSVNGKQSSGFAFGASTSASAPGSNAPSIFNFGGSSAPASNSSPGLSFGAASSTSALNNTSSGFSFGLGSSPLVPAASSGSAPIFAFGASAPTIASTSTSSPFQFGAATSTAQTSSSSMFNSAGLSSTPVFGFGAAPSSSVVTPPPTSQPVFGNGGSVFPFGSMATSPSNNGQMTMEDSMAEDSSNPPQAAGSIFGQLPVGQQQQQPSGGFIFGTPSQVQPAGANPFQFGGQQQQGQVGLPQNSSPFGATPGGGGSFELGAGGSFSLGAGGNDKSGRRMVRVNRKPRKK